MSKGVLTTLITFVIAIMVVIAGFFLLEIDKVTLNFWAFGSLIFSLLVSLLTTLTMVATKKKRDGVFYVAGINSAIWIYQIAVIIVVLCTRFFADHLYRFILAQIIINAVYLITIIVIFNISKSIYNSNQKTQYNLDNGEYDAPKRGGF